MRLSSHFRPATRMDTGSSEALIYFCMQEKRSMLSFPRRRESIATRNAVVDSRLRGNDGLWQFYPQLEKPAPSGFFKILLVSLLVSLLRLLRNLCVLIPHYSRIAAPLAGIKSIKTPHLHANSAIAPVASRPSALGRCARA